MDRLLDFTFVILLPSLVTIAFVYWTMKVCYSKRFIPTIMQTLLAILVFFVPIILVSFDVINGGFGPAIMSIVLFSSLILGSFVNLIVIFTIKKNDLPN
ncbi:hypothetical protein CR203_22040 [Salipaludibacillus neizhouensis]|uniref:YesK-like protein n=1 Tax=Salipaludibacillus neizhouensis TaxID=885475 RepID=A0A3A9K1L6_9BACI|nr:hypothetical protein CR203_22040 [Salipaludibacillus neizhouensis]